MARPSVVSFDPDQPLVATNRFPVHLSSSATAVLAAVPYHTFPDFQLGPLTIRSFGLLVALGIVAGAMLGARYVANRDLDPDEYTSVASEATRLLSRCQTK